MPESIPDYPLHISNLERRLRLLKRNIIGAAAAGETAISNPATTSLFQAELDTAIAEWEEFQRVWEEFEATHTHANIEFPAQTWQDTYDAVRRGIITAKSHLITIERASSQSAAGASIAQAHTNARQSLDMSLNASARAHLPQIPLPEFSGDLLKWTHFKDTFTSMVHNESTLTNVEKFHYLLGALRGEAASLISRLPIEDKNYSQAWRKLMDNYDNPRVLASLFIQKILDCDFKGTKNELERYDKFLAEVADCIEGFKALSLHDPADFVLATLALRSLDSSTRRHFELARAPGSTFPTADEVIKFVRQRKTAITMSRDIVPAPSCAAEEPSRRSLQYRFPVRTSRKYSSVALHTSTGGMRNMQGLVNSLPRAKASTSLTATGVKQTPEKRKPPVCPFCQSAHMLPHCFKFSNLPQHERLAFIQSLKCCRNCLRNGHSTSGCKSKWSCRFCKQRHHSLVHGEETAATPNHALVSQDSHQHNTGETFIGFGSTPSQPCASAILLGTTQLYLVSEHGRLIPARAVLDSGSQHTFITQSLASELKAKMKSFKGQITGLGGSSISSPAGSIPCFLRSIYSQDQFSTEALVVEQIAPSLPNVSLPEHLVAKLFQFRLADKHFHVPGPIDMLIGMDLYPSIITGAPRNSGIAELYLQPTALGLVVLGKVRVKQPSQSISLFTESQSAIEEQLKAFWELEEPKPADMRDPEHKICEEHFVRTHMRTPEGRYIVRLPLRPGIDALGRNREVATKRFLNLEGKFRSDSQFRTNYMDFIREYEELGHLSPAPSQACYLIPHHGIWQQSASSKKLRVVFDASCTSSSFKSLNSFLLTGPKLQADICDVLINFRLFRIPLCADLVKMYRQILLHPDDRHLQHILWRDDPSEALRELQLNTVTYGVKSSAYQALRVIQQLVKDEGHEFPLATRIISTSMYVDDIVAGADNIEEARELQRQLIALFQRGGFTLGKWASTVPELIAVDEVDEKMLPVQIMNHDSDSIKILGLVWNPTNDAFSYAVVSPPRGGVTKRVVLSSIARIFDPLGMLAPVIFAVKILLQDLWKLKLGWDELIPPEMTETWVALIREWHSISRLSIKRHISDALPSGCIIGFCDASTKGYAAAIYCRTEDSHGHVNVHLLKAKTKVAPLKYRSTARLELCGALLLARLLASINIPWIKRLPPFCFTDSRVVLCWLRTPSHQLTVFEANRTSQIREIKPVESWFHVASHDNPCDLASRGCLPSLLHDCRSWWHGPSWLTQPVTHWAKTQVIFTPPHTSEASVCLSSVKDLNHAEFMTRFSEFNKLIRVFALVARFLTAIRPPHTKMIGPITAEEFHEAKLRCVRLVQKTLQMKELSQLCPFNDEQGIIRVGGRLQEASIPKSAKHPILLPRRHHFSRLIIRSTHERHFHAGPTLTLALLRNEYWIPGAMKLIRSVISSCVHCRIRKAKPSSPIMASLPKERLTELRAFYEVGLDYAGPFQIKTTNRRNSPTTKAYLCLFVCMSTKAVHLEAVSSLTTVSFLAALDRFISRRGIPQTFWSDHGTNFVGAARFIKDVYKFLHENEDDLIQWLAPKNVQWKFIPPRAPHFGGLWEAGVKSVKSLLAASVGFQPYTYEELSTIFIRIEGILNSRPLCALNEDIENCEYLSPAHFLIGSPLTTLPEHSDRAPIQTLTNRWERIQEHIRSIWGRWRQEYLHTLQQRGKWATKTPNISKGDLVIMIERRSLVGHWPIARVIDTHPGKDGVVRAVSVRTPSNKIFVRAVASLAPLFDPGDNGSTST